MRRMGHEKTLTSGVDAVGDFMECELDSFLA